jgi:hypothetical protein
LSANRRATRRRPGLWRQRSRPWLQAHLPRQLLQRRQLPRLRARWVHWMAVVALLGRYGHSMGRPRLRGASTERVAVVQKLWRRPRWQHRPPTLPRSKPGRWRWTTTTESCAAVCGIGADEGVRRSPASSKMPRHTPHTHRVHKSLNRIGVTPCACKMYAGVGYGYCIMGLASGKCTPMLGRNIQNERSHLPATSDTPLPLHVQFVHSEFHLYILHMHVALNHDSCG